MGYSFNQNIQYYDHFSVKEVPLYLSAYAEWKKEVSLLNKEVNILFKELEKIEELHLSQDLDDKPATLSALLDDYMTKIKVDLNSLKADVDRVSSKKKPFEENRWAFKKAFQLKLESINGLVRELEPVKREATSYVESILFVVNNYLRKKTSSNFNPDLKKWLESLLASLLPGTLRQS